MTKKRWSMLGSIFSGICFCRNFCLKDSLASKATFCMYRQIKIFYHDNLINKFKTANQRWQMIPDPSFIMNYVIEELLL